jgi:hypothetical protein
MRHWGISIAITASHFFLLTLVWFAMGQFVSQHLSPILAVYLFIGPLPYLYQAYARRKRFDPLIQILTYLLGIGALIMTLGFVWQCRIQVVRIRIPMVVNDPPWMTTLSLMYIGAGAFLSYLMTLLSKPKPSRRPPKPYLAPSGVTNPLLIGILKRGEGTEADRQDSKRSSG